VGCKTTPFCDNLTGRFRPNPDIQTEPKDD
jgi:hypothetical protein